MQVSTIRVIAKPQEIHEKIAFFNGLAYEKIAEFPYKLNLVQIIFRRVINESQQ